MTGPAPSLRELEAALDSRRLRQIAWLLIGYGVAGLAALAVIAVVAAESLGSIAPLGDSLESERQQLVQTLRQTSSAIADAGTGTLNAGGSLGEARGSASQAAGLSRTLATTMGQLAAASQVSILGSQPLAGLGQGFGQASSEARLMGDSLDRVATALGKNGDDVSRVKGDLDALSRQVSSLAATVEAMPAFAGPTSGAGTLRLVFGLLVLWLAVPALAALVAGIRLRRWLIRHEGPPVEGARPRRSWRRFRRT